MDIHHRRHRYRGDLLDSAGQLIESNDTGRVLPNPDNFFLWRTLAPGTYYIKVSGYESAQGTYSLNTKTFRDTTGRSNTAELKLNGSASGMLDPEFERGLLQAGAVRRCRRYHSQLRLPGHHGESTRQRRRPHCLQ